MFIAHPLDLLVVANDRARDLCREASVARLRRAAGSRHVLAASLRRLADRLDPTPLAARPA
ncbi:MAG: hypothetical protein ABI717_06210 [Actinomycetota bacterium]